MQSRISIICTYFGRIPEYFEAFLKSCEYNPSIQWFFFTDDVREFNYPPNFKRVLMDFETLTQKIDEVCGFKTALTRPYKLTDFKPVYGLVFSDYIKDADFWGFCDIDLVFGDIRGFLSTEILKDHDKILDRGHLTLFKNKIEINTLFRQPIRNKLVYKTAFTNSSHLYFDEWGKGDVSLNRIFEYYNNPVYLANIFHDLNPTKYSFKPFNTNPSENLNKHNCYIWKNGHLYFTKNGSMTGIKEVLYVHFQKRKIKINGDLGDNFVIVPNEILPGEPPANLKKYTDPKNQFLRRDFWEFYARGLKRKTKKLFKGS
ncbi:DUF6625 family protein [Pleomorphovibrio marinus]|uniref:DUF6625 family protein n=1 Tax=Pleomorphovibrio marinus TaxID=2164132 RepID=UPI000E0C952A|nr:DUF6625 family protein [Pleomorphovibrio marinus]